MAAGAEAGAGAEDGAGVAAAGAEAGAGWGRVLRFGQAAAGLGF